MHARNTHATEFPILGRNHHPLVIVTSVLCVLREESYGHGRTHDFRQKAVRGTVQSLREAIINGLEWIESCVVTNQNLLMPV